MIWAAFLASNIAFIIGAVILWNQVKADFSESIAWGTIITLNLFPTSFFFSAIYAEGLFLLLSSLVYLFSAREKYLLAALCVSGASVARPNGLLLVLIPLIEALRSKSPRPWFREIAIALVSGSGVAAYAGFLAWTHRAPLAFASVESQSWQRSIVWPWKTLWDGLRVTLVGQPGYGRFPGMRDLLATVLFGVCAALGPFLVRKSLAVYLLAALVAFLVVHGPHAFGLYSMSRFVLGLFPGFIVLAILLDHCRPGMRWLLWSTSAVLMLALTGFFAAGGWAG